LIFSFLETVMTESNGRTRLSARRKEVEVDIEEDDGSVRTYTVRELNGTLRDQFFDSMNRRATGITSEGVRSFKTFKGMYSDLLSLSLFDAHDQPVPADTIQQWPSSTQEELFRIASQLSGLDRKAVERAKNSSMETTSADSGSD